MLTPEVRKRVAEECGHKLSGWWPHGYGEHFRALARTAARLIEEAPESDKDYMPDPRKHYDPLLRHAVATDDVNALERLVAELKGFV